MSIGERLCAERKRLGMTQIELSERCGVSKTSQSLYESDRRVPDASYLAALGEIGGNVALVVTGKDASKQLDAEHLTGIFGLIADWEAKKGRNLTHSQRAKLVGLLYTQALETVDVGNLMTLVEALSDPSS